MRTDARRLSHNLLSVSTPTSDAAGSSKMGQPYTLLHSLSHFLREFFETHIISQLLWPPWCPDLTPSDFFSEDLSRTAVFARHPKSIEDLEQFITEAIAEITSQMSKKVFCNLRRRVTTCLALDGGHI